MRACVIELPLGISGGNIEGIGGLTDVLGHFQSINFNLARVGERAFSLRIIRSGNPNAQESHMTIDETIGGLLEDNLPLTYGEHVEVLEHIGSAVRVRFTTNQKL